MIIRILILIGLLLSVGCLSTPSEKRRAKIFELKRDIKVEQTRCQELRTIDELQVKLYNLRGTF